MGKIAAAFVVIAMAGAPAAAQEADPGAAPSPDARRVTVTTGMDFPTAYVFRGILQEDEGLIAQPPVDLALSLGRGISMNVGKWDSLHAGDTGTYYESDYYAAVTFTAGRLKPGLLFTSYTSPNERFGTVAELAGVVAFDDSGSRFPLSPKAVIAFELDGQADGGANRGTYLELGVRPSLPLAPRLSLAIPVKIGVSLKDYYEGPAGSDRFGYLETGLVASVPILSGAGGTLEAHGGVSVLTLGDNLEAVNGGDGVKPVGVFGIAYVY